MHSQKSDEQWNLKAKAVADHYSEHGNLPKLGTGTPTEETLANWLKKQRSAHKNGLLARPRVETLGAISPEALRIRVANIDMFLVNLEATRKYFDKTGELPVNSRTKNETSVLGGWLSAQRFSHRRGQLPAEKVEALESITRGIWATSYQSNWQDRCAEVRNHIQAHGTVPTRTAVEASVAEMGTWIDAQRVKNTRGELEASQIDALNRIHPHILASKAVRKVAFDVRLEELRDFIQANGRLPARKSPEEAELDSWIRYYRYASKSAVQRAKLFEVIDEHVDKSGRSFDDIRSWDEGLALVKEHIAQTGKLPTRGSGKVEEGRLAAWMSRNQQNAAKGLLSADQLQRLESELGWDADGVHHIRMRESAWHRKLELARVFFHDNGMLPTEANRPTDFPAQWVRLQRHEYKNGKLNPFRLAASQAKLPELLAGITPRA